MLESKRFQMQSFERFPAITILTKERGTAHAHFEPSDWIGERWIGCIIVPGPVFIWGRFLNVDASTCECNFKVDELSQEALLHPGKSHKYTESYWGERAQLVFDSSRQWVKEDFKPRDAILHKNDGTSEEIPGGWEHEHCDICCKTISDFGDADKCGYKSNNNTWLCEACHENHVMRKNLDFIPNPQQ